MSLAASERARTLAPDLIWIDTNCAHALMFLKRTREARALYLTRKGQMPSGKPREGTIMEDFALLRRAGLAHPLMVQIEKALRVAHAPAARHGQRRHKE